MKLCGHCNEKFKGIERHIMHKHGFPFTCLGPTLDMYYGKNDPPEFQQSAWPDSQMKCRLCEAIYFPQYDKERNLLIWPETDICNMCI